MDKNTRSCAYLKERKWLINEPDLTLPYLISNFLLIFFSSQTRIGKQRCNLDPLIGAPYGTYFEARAGKLYKLDKKPELSLSFPIAGVSLIWNTFVSVTDINDRMNRHHGRRRPNEEEQ